MKKILSLLLTLVMSVAAWAEDPYYEIVAGDLSASSMTITLKVTFPDATTVDPYFMTNYNANLYNKYHLLMAYKRNNTGVQVDGNSFILPLDVFQHSDETDDLTLVLEKYSVKVDGDYITSDLTLYPKKEAPAEPPYFWVKNISGSEAGILLFPDKNIEYTKDPEGGWNAVTNYWTVILANDEKVYLRAASPDVENNVMRPYSAEFDYAIGGDITTLLVPEGNIDELPEITDGRSVFAGLFWGENYLVDASALVLPSTKLSSGCYESMFYECVNLVAAPVLPALELAPFCYFNLFSGCSKLDHVKAYFTDWGAPEDMCTMDWLRETAPAGTFEGHAWVADCGFDHIPAGWLPAHISSMDITVPQTGYTTFGYNNDKYNWIIPEGMEGYAVQMTYEEHELVTEKVLDAGDIVENKFIPLAILLKAAPGRYTINFTEEDGNLFFSPIFKAEPARTDLSLPYWANDYRYFTLSADENGENVGFYPVEGDGRPFVVSPFQGYLNIEQYYFPDGAVHPLLIEKKDDSDGIQNVKTEQNAVIYDLCGRRLTQPVKGKVNIIDGRNIFVK